MFDSNDRIEIKNLCGHYWFYFGPNATAAEETLVNVLLLEKLFILFFSL